MNEFIKNISNLFDYLITTGKISATFILKNYKKELTDLSSALVKYKKNESSGDELRKQLLSFLKLIGITLPYALPIGATTVFVTSILLLKKLRLDNYLPNSFKESELNIKKFKDFVDEKDFNDTEVNEKLDISMYKKYLKLLKPNELFYDIIKELFKMYSDHDKHYNRIYFPFKDDVVAVIPKEILNFFNPVYFNLTSDLYKKGLVYIHTKQREEKLGRFLQDSNRLDLLKIFETDPQRQLKSDEYYAVFCRHPYDLLGMSTGRGWTSCRYLGYGDSALNLINSDMRWGCIVSYMIRKNDRNINNPLMRMKFFRRNLNNTPIKGSDFSIPKEGFILEDSFMTYGGVRRQSFIDLCKNIIEDMNKKLKELQK